MKNMESKLYEAALAGSVTTLLELLQQDRLILERAAMNCSSETPLHVASLLGHEDFAKEILRQKPGIAGELDSRKSSALHIASQKGYVGIVKALLEVNPDMCSAKDVDGRNPLHLAAMKGQVDVLEELVRTRPLVASAPLIWGETILHLCVKHNQLEALKLLMENMEDPQFLNAKDDYGMTILHLAVADKQIEAIKFLTTSTIIKVNAVNANGFTAWDILAQSKRDIKDWEIGELLRRAGAISAKDMQPPGNELAVTQTNSLTSQENNQKHKGQKGLKRTLKNEDDWLEKKRNAIMVVASLIATMAFQAGVNPPHLPSQESSSSQNTALTTEPEPPTARFPIDGYRYKYYISYYPFLVLNTTGFLASLSIILLLISGLPLNSRLFMWILMVTMWVAITAMAMTYAVSIDYLTDPVISYSSTSTIVIFVWTVVGGVLVLGHSSRLMVKMIKRIRKSIRRPSHIQAQDGHDCEPPLARTV
ncbi:hypothetical protein AB3S75_013272 [Citrus x aurantiifolia]